MPNLNKCYLMGGLTRDPESIQTAKGTTITNFTLAINNTYKNSAGDKVEEVTYVDFDCFGRVAEVIAEHCKKGHTILAIGRLKLDYWEDRESGQKRSKMKVICEEFQFISRPRSEEEERPRQQSRPPQRTQQLRKPSRDPDLDSVDEVDQPY